MRCKRKKKQGYSQRVNNKTQKGKNEDECYAAVCAYRSYKCFYG